MQFDLKCQAPDCVQFMRLTVDTVEQAVKLIASEGWTMGVDNRTSQQRIADHIKAAQSGSLAVIPALCKTHNPTERKGMKISELIEALWTVKHQHGDLLCQVEDGLDPSDFADVTALRVEMDSGGIQIVKINA